MSRYSKEKALVFSIVFSLLLASGCLEKKVSDMLNGNRNGVEAMEGELFLEGPDERRVPFCVGREDALKAFDIISQGRPTWDGKYQGRAYFNILYVNNIEDRVAVTDKIVRVNERPISVDMDRLLALLQRIERRVQGQEE